jgi:hypothetical protein
VRKIADNYLGLVEAYLSASRGNGEEVR